MFHRLTLDWVGQQRPLRVGVGVGGDEESGVRVLSASLSVVKEGGLGCYQHLLACWRRRRKGEGVVAG